ncbi:MAG TPA: UMP kinase [Bacteroidales bacterium]|nr:UMP kinase [Bacteroidales bacterium]MDI9573877.1 UMP kinase [Bacteroidota bacterium]OQC59895.1 MAG: Uridylate kinase [Bacteroidetes bacterium ADurb.Bin012]MBP9511649.1 UMP kinase [Bacteroidales bacterium]MBP9587971.1 UMP kinase [Bacteroidales bacterium]
MTKYRRILLKLSGESLMGEQNYGIDPIKLADYASEIEEIVKMGVQVAIVMGGGNIFRGLQGVSKGIDRVQGDYMGMLATIINCMALQAELEKNGIGTVLLGGLEVRPIVMPMSRLQAIAYLEAGKVVIISGGTGNPYFTTDTASALRGIEVKADILLKGTRVDGVYTADPEKSPNAVKYSRLTFQEAYSKGLKILDLTAFSLCMENNLPIYVFNMDVKGNLIRLIKGEHIGTLISNNFQ